MVRLNVDPRCSRISSQMAHGGFNETGSVHDFCSRAIFQDDNPQWRHPCLALSTIVGLFQLAFTVHVPSSLLIG